MAVHTNGQLPLKPEIFFAHVLDAAYRIFPSARDAKLAALQALTAAHNSMHWTVFMACVTALGGPLEVLERLIRAVDELRED